VLADYLRKNEMRTIVGPIRYGKDGEWATPRVLMIQFRGVVDKDVEQFRRPGKQVILAPAQFKSGDLAHPFEKARRA
jgi:branched-chain amino acid transport system substrate-binding protein